jgi:hypothetical protein
LIIAFLIFSLFNSKVNIKHKINSLVKNQHRKYGIIKKNKRSGVMMEDNLKIILFFAAMISVVGLLVFAFVSIVKVARSMLTMKRTNTFNIDVKIGSANSMINE